MTQDFLFISVVVPLWPLLLMSLSWFREDLLVLASTTEETEETLDHNELLSLFFVVVISDDNGSLSR